MARRPLTASQSDSSTAMPWRNCEPKYDTSDRAVHAYAAEQDVHPSIVAGLLRKESGNYKRYSIDHQRARRPRNYLPAMIRYIPFLKAKRGDLNAMSELAPEVKQASAPS